MLDRALTHGMIRSPQIRTFSVVNRLKQVFCLLAIEKVDILWVRSAGMSAREQTYRPHSTGNEALQQCEVDERML